MSRDDRIAELLGGYPDQLTDDELAELRQAAAIDPEIEASLDAIHEAEFLLSMDDDDVRSLSLDGELSERGEERLGDAIRQAREVAAPVAAPAAARIVPLRRHEDRPQWTGWIALAAGLVLAGGTVVLSRSPAPSGADDLHSGSGSDFSMKGAEPPAAVSGDLMIRGTEAAAWSRGSPRSLDKGLRFYAVVPQPTYLALVEVQNANAVVLHPAAGSQWRVEAGTHLLQPPAASPDYVARVGGRARYVLVGSVSSLSVPSGGVITSASALVSGNPGSRVLGEVEVAWQAPR